MSELFQHLDPRKIREMETKKSDSTSSPTFLDHDPIPMYTILHDPQNWTIGKVEGVESTIEVEVHESVSYFQDTTPIKMTDMRILAYSGTTKGRV